MNISGEIHVHKTETPIADLPVLDEVSGDEKLKVYDNGVAKSVTTGMLIAGATDAISIGIDEDDGLLYLYVNGQKQGDGVEIGGTVTTRYTITYTLDPHMVSSNMATRVAENSSYHAVISSDHVDYQVQNISVTMGGQNITATAVDGNNIDIASVTGNITITVTALFFASVETRETYLKVSSGGTQTLGVRLHAQPTQTQTVSVHGDGVTVSSATLTFTEENWNTYQDVTITAGSVEETEYHYVTLTNSDPLLTDSTVMVEVGELQYEDLVDTTIPAEGMHTVTLGDFNTANAYSSGGVSYIRLSGYNAEYPNIKIPATIDGKSVIILGASASPSESNTSFATNTTIQYVTFENGVKIGEGGAPLSNNSANLFHGCTSLIGVSNIPADVTNLSSAFSGCTALKFVDNLNALVNCTSINKTFSSASGIEYIQDLSAMTKLSNVKEAFKGCSHLVKVFGMPELNTTTADATNTYANCTSLQSGVIPKGVSNLAFAFYSDAALRKVVIYEDNLATSAIPSSTFSGCKNLTVYCNANTTTYDSLISAYGSSSQVTIKTFDGASVSSIVVWGDSISSPNKAWLEWPARLQTKLGTNDHLVKNEALAGEWSTSTTARQGGYAMTVDAFTIPADTTAAEITITVNSNETFSTSPLFSAGGSFNPCTIAGVAGTVSRSGSQYYFTRLKSGTAVSVSAGTTITSNNDDVFNNSDNVMLFYLNGNAGWDDDAEKLMDMFKKAVAHFSALGGTKYIVAGPATGVSMRNAGVRAQVFRFEELAAEEFGDHWFNLREYEINNGLTQNNLTASELDTERMAIGQVPASLIGGGTTSNILMYDGNTVTDDSHPNAYGSNTIMLGFYEKGVALGYWNAST